MQNMQNINTIVTHSGGAHLDEIYTCSILLGKYKNIKKICRRKDADLKIEEKSSNEIWVDCGKKLDPKLMVFDHHQKSENPIDCSFWLICQELQIHETVLELFSWYRAVNVIDCNGPMVYCKTKNISIADLFEMKGGFDPFITEEFSKEEELTSDHWLFQFLARFGERFHKSIKEIENRLNTLNENGKFYQLPVGDKEITYAVHTLRDEAPQFGINHWFKINGKEVAFIVTPDSTLRNPEGWSFLRINDHPMIDYNRLDEYEDSEKGPVIFIHSNGFTAKTKAMTRDEAVKLALKAVQ